MNGMIMKKLFGFMLSDFGVWFRLWVGRVFIGNYCKFCIIEKVKVSIIYIY